MHYVTCNQGDKHMLVDDHVMQNVRKEYAEYLKDMEITEKDFSVEDFMDEILRYYKCEFYEEWYTDKHDMSDIIKEKYDLLVALDNEEEWLDEYGLLSDRDTWF